jgi:electron transfer flavoprotein beta subunit
MKILLCASKTPDTTTKINFSADKKSLDASGVQFILNPYDDHGLARAMDLKEKHNAQLTVIHVGDISAEPILRRCLAIGADEAILINANPSDSYYVATQIAEAIKGENFDLIMTGRESIDFNGNAVADMLAEELGIPSVAYVTDIEINGTTATLKRFIDGGEEKLTVNLPVVISATKELAEPRIANMRGIMQSRTKPIKTVEAASVQPLTSLVTFEPPVKKSSIVMIDAAEAGKLMDILHEKEKVI